MSHHPFGFVRLSLLPPTVLISYTPFPHTKPLPNNLCDLTAWKKCDVCPLDFQRDIFTSYKLNMMTISPHLH